MSKNLRVFLLSVLVLMLAASSALAAASPSDITFTWVGGTSTAWRLASNWSADQTYATIKTNDAAYLDDSVQENTYYPGGVVYKSTAAKITAVIPNDANLILNGSLIGNVDVISIDASEGRVSGVNYTGAVTIDLGAYDMRGNLALKVGSGSNVVINATGGKLNVGSATSWDVYGGLTLNAPVLLNAKNASLDISKYEVSSTSTKKNLVINSPINKAAASYTPRVLVSLDKTTSGASTKVTLTTNQKCLLSPDVILKVGDRSTVVFNTDGSGSPKVELGAGATFNVGSGYTVSLTAASHGITTATKFTKAGAGTLKLVGARGSLRPSDTATATYANKYYVVKTGVLASLANLAQITVSAGTLSIAADTADSNSGGHYQTEGRYITSRDLTTSAGTAYKYDYTPAITVATGKSLDIVVKDGATLDVGTYSIREQIAPTEAVKITVENGGTANIAEMGIFSRAYKDNVTTAALVDSSDNYATPVVFSRVSLDISGTLNITGNQAVRTITNSNTAGKGGAITVADGKELILVLGEDATSADLEPAYYDYYGTIEADNVGLIGKFVNYPFRVGVNDAVVTINTLKVYGGSELMLDDQTQLSSSESIYLRKKGSNSSFSAMTVGKLTITSGEVEIPGTLKIDGAGRSTGVAVITFSKDVTKSKTDTKPALTVTTTEIHANASEVGTNYVGGLAMVVSGDGALTLNTVTGNPVNAHPDAAVRVTGSADLVLNGSIPATSGITVNEGATLEVAQGVRMAGNLDLNKGAILKATLTAPNATSNGTYAVTVEKGLTLSTNLSLDVELADDELGTLPTTYSRTYKVVGVTDAANLKVISADNFNVALLNDDTANIFKTKTSTISTDTFLDEKGVFLELAANIQQPVLGEASFDKSTFGANKQFTVTIPVTYSSAYSEHYENYITINSVDANINANGVRAIASYNPTTKLVTVAGTSTTNTAEIEVKIGWIKGTSADLANTYAGLGSARNTSVATAMDETVSKRHWVEIDGLALDFFIPMTKKITLEGTAEVVDPTEPEEVEGIEITPADADGWAVDPASPDALLKFTVQGLRVASSTNILVGMLNGKYVWDNGYDTTKTYEMLSSDGNYYAVDPVVVAVDGEGVPMDSVTIEASETNSNAVDIFIPTKLIANNSDANGTPREIAVRGTLEGGKVISSPKITVTVTKNNLGTVEVDGGTAQADADGKVTTYEPYTITASDDLGTVPATGWTVSDLPDWLEANPEAGTLELLLKQDYTGTVTAGPVVVTVVANGTVGTRTYRVAINVVGAKGTFDSIVVPSSATQSSVQNGSAIAPIAFRTSPDVPASWEISTGAPSWITASGNNTATFTLSGTASETTFPATYTFTVTASADGKTDTANVSITVVEPVLAVEFDDSSASAVEGYNYRASLTASNASGDVTWTLSSTAPAWIKAAKTGATTAVLEGLVPEYVEDYEDEDPNEITFTVTATDASGATAEAEVSISVEEDSSATSATIPNVTVTPAAGVEAATVKADYSVEITFPVDEDGAPTITVDDLESINLPRWLTYEPKMNADDEVTGLVLKYNAVNGVAQGTRGTVRIPVSGADDYDVLGWDVVYDVPAPALTLTVDKASLNLRVGSSDTVTLTPANAQGEVTYTASETWVTFSGNTATFAPTMAGTYTVTITATDAGRTTDNTATATVAVTVTRSGGDTPTPTTFGVTATPTTLSIVAGRTATVTLAASNAQGTVSYTANQTWVTFSGNTATFAPTTAGTYTVTITATDAGRTTGNTATATVTVTVTDGGTPTPVESEDFALTTTRSVSLNLATLGGNTSTITLAPANALGAVSYTYTVTPSTGLTVSISGNTATLTAESTGTYTVVFTATDAGRTTGNTATFTTTVTVSSGIVSPDVRSIGSSGGGCDAGFGALALVLAAPLFLRRRRS